MAQRFFDITSALNAVINHDDTHAFEYVFDIFYEKMMRVALYYLDKDTAAEDAVSEVFYKLWSHRSKLGKVENIENYLFTMTKNQCLTAIRSGNRISFDGDQGYQSQLIIIENPETNLISEEFIQFYNQKVNELSPKCKLVYLMVKDDGMKYKQVAELLNISVKTVENQMTKAIKHIRSCLSKYQDYHSNLNFSKKL